MSLRKQTPSDFLKQIIGRPVVVKLNSGVDYRGTAAAMLKSNGILMSITNVIRITADVCQCAGVLACLDGYMNIAIEQTEEYVNGQLKNKYGDAFLRGNNGKVAHC
ncbi:U4/U6-U5 snRNP complex subunit lsm6 [Ilyodon furcidens]|uniref:U4/U6-U5 snRNP complex subunit lsm6 n=1 Tax=Ilyodon furcidens TaxID=33524 RepID=A0ABV0TVY3_9TELE